jgi:hypothetical protein
MGVGRLQKIMMISNLFYLRVILVDIQTATKSFGMEDASLK